MKVLHESLVFSEGGLPHRQLSIAGAARYRLAYLSAELDPSVITIGCPGPCAGVEEFRLLHASALAATGNQAYSLFRKRPP